MKFFIKIYLVNVTKPADSCEFCRDDLRLYKRTKTSLLYEKQDFEKYFINHE